MDEKLNDNEMMESNAPEPGDAAGEPDAYVPDPQPEPFEPEPPAAPGPPPAPEPPMSPPPPQQSYNPPPPPQYSAPVGSEKNRTTAGILAILLGSLGIHKFYLGYNTEGIILLAVTVLTMGMLSWATAVIGVVEGIMYLTKSDEEFYATYVAGSKKWF